MEQRYILENVQSFEPVHIFECGQCFRWNKQENNSYTGIVKNNVINVKKETGKENNTTAVVTKLNQVALIIGGTVTVIIILAMIISYYQKRQLTKWIENQKR